MFSISASPMITENMLKKEIEQAKSSHVLNLKGYRFDQNLFEFLTDFLSTSPGLSRMHFTKNLLDQSQTEKILQITNGNLMKGVKLLDEEDKPFGDAYTDWHNYNEDKKEACGLNEATLDALNFSSPPTHVIDFGAGTGKETITLLQNGCTSVVAIDGDEGAIEILKRRGETFINTDRLEIYKGPFLGYQPKKQADLFLSSLTWPYRPQEDFAECWKKTVACVKPDGWIAGHFFGAPETPNPAMSYHTKEQIVDLLSNDFKNVSIREEAVGERKIYGGETPPWGTLYHVSAQKKS